MTRASTDKSQATSHRLRRLTVIGGFLDGIDCEFAPGLNCIIGGRGTGKTTLLEFIRYALDILPEDAAKRRKTQGLIDHNLAGGRIRLTIETKDGLTYIVSRTAGEAPVVLDSQGNLTDIALHSGGVFGTDIYSQNDVEGIADEPLSQLALIDSFEAEELRKDDLQIHRALSALKANAHECIEVQKVIGGVAGELGTLQGLEAKLKEFKVASGQDAETVNQAHECKAQRDRETRAIAEVRRSLLDYARQINAMLERIGRDIAPILGGDAVAGPNAPAVEAMREVLLTCGRETDRLLAKAESRVRAGEWSLSAEADRLATIHQEQDTAFDRLIETRKEAMSQSAERTGLERRRNEILAQKRVHDQKIEELDKLLKDREALLVKFSKLRDHRFAIRKCVADRINAQVQPQIRVAVEQYGNTEKYRAMLESCLQGAGLQHRVVAAKIAACISPSDLRDAIAQDDVDTLVDRSEINPDQARKIIAALSGGPELYELQTVELIDLPSIELLDVIEYKNSLTLSTGQKCTSVLPILLLDSEKPLLIDQPEDNLDNRFIFTTVVKRLCEVKKNRQMIFITHNPNIPVLGDADKVFVLTSSGQRAAIEKEGSVDTCQREIVTLLEGGEEAFRERRKRYNY